MVKQAHWHPQVSSKAAPAALTRRSTRLKHKLLLSKERIRSSKHFNRVLDAGDPHQSKGIRASKNCDVAFANPSNDDLSSVGFANQSNDGYPKQSNDDIAFDGHPNQSNSFNGHPNLFNDLRTRDVAFANPSNDDLSSVGFANQSNDGYPNHSNDDIAFIGHPNQSNSFEGQTDLFNNFRTRDVAFANPSNDDLSSVGFANQSNDGYPNHSKAVLVSKSRKQSAKKIRTQRKSKALPVSKSRKQSAKKSRKQSAKKKKNQKQSSEEFINPLSPFTLATELHDTLKGINFKEKGAECTVREALQAAFPTFRDNSDDFTKKQFQNLVKCIENLLNKKNGDPEALVHDCKVICKAIEDVYPRAEMFEMQRRYARPPPRDYKHDLIGTLFMLNQHFPGKTLTDFLYQCRAISVYPQCKKRTRLRIFCEGVSGTADEPFENAVKKIDCSLQLLYAHIRSDNESTFNRLRHASVHKNYEYHLPMKQGASVPICPNESYVPYNRAAPPPPFKKKAKANSSNEQSNPSNGQSNPSNSDGSPSNGQSNPSNGQSNPSNEQSNPSSEQSNPSNGQSNPSNSDGSPSNGQSNPSNEQLNPSNGQSNPSNSDGSPSNGQSNPSNEQSNPSNGQSNPSNSDGSPSNGHSNPSNEQSNPSNGQSNPSNSDGSRPSNGQSNPSNGQSNPSSNEQSNPSNGQSNPSNSDGSPSNGQSNPSFPPCLRLDMAPFAAFHMPGSFKNRIWLTNDTVMMSFLLFRFIFFKSIKYDHSDLYKDRGMNVDEKVLQFLFNAATDRKDRRLWMEMLFHLAIMFDSVEKIERVTAAKDHRSIFNLLLHEGKEDHLISEFDDDKISSTPDQVSMICHCFRELNKFQKFSVSFRVSKYRNGEFKEPKNYQAVRGWIFLKWMEFGSKENRELKNLVFLEMKWKKPGDGDEREKGKTSDTTTDCSNNQADRAVRLSALATANKAIELSPLADLLASNDGHPIPSNDGHPIPSNDGGSSNGHPIPSNDGHPIPSNDGGSSNGHPIPSNIGNPRQSSNVFTYSYYLRDENINSLAIVSKDYLNSKVRSALNVHTKEEKYELHLAPVEVYSAGNLHEHTHGRKTAMRSQAVLQEDCVHVRRLIPSGVLTYVDPTLSVVRPLSSIYQKPNPLRLDFKSILRLIAVAGATDAKRRKQWSSSIEFGVKAELFHQSPDGFLYGKKHFSNAALPEEERERARASVAHIMDFLWEIGNGIEKAICRRSLGGNRLRRARFGYPVGAMFGTIKSEFESVTIAHSILYPHSAQCSQHQDELNDSIGGYDKTLCLDLALVGVGGEIHLLQVLCNFRSACRDRLHTKIQDRVDKIKRDVLSYERNLRTAYDKRFNVEAKIPNPLGFSFLDKSSFDLDHFFLDNQLKFEETRIAKDKDIMKQLLMVPIGSSRLISLSMAIDPIYHNRDRLNINQLLEICFFASFVSATTTLSHVLWSLVKDHSLFAEENVHPFVLLKQRFAAIFGGVHTGIKPRYSSSSNRFLDLVTAKEKDKGKEKNTVGVGDDGEIDEEQVEEAIELLAVGNTTVLDTICDSLLDFIDFVDSNVNKDIPYPSMERIIKSTLQNIRNATKNAKGTSLDFGHFRLSIFTSWATGLGLLLPGAHLHQIITPAPNTASMKHLLNPSLRNNFNYSAAAKDVDFDYEMKVVSDALGFPTYRRDRIEVLLCESKPGRDLKKCDVFELGQSLFRLNDKGFVQVKEFGGDNNWIDVKPKGRQEEDRTFR